MTEILGDGADLAKVPVKFTEGKDVMAVCDVYDKKVRGNRVPRSTKKRSQHSATQTLTARRETGVELW